MRSKRGLSDIVATVLIILLAISAVVLIGYFVNNLIKRFSTQGDLAQLCLTTEVEATVCRNSTTPGNVDVLVKLNQGKKEDISLITAVVEFSNGETTRADNPGANTPDVQNTVTIPIAHGGRTATKAWAIVQVQKGEDTLFCKESTKINCS